MENDILNEIISGCKNQNREAQHRLYEIYAKRMTALCFRYCGDRETARDLMHDGFIRIFSHIDEYSGVGNFEGWLRKIFVNVSLDFIRRNEAENNKIQLEVVENFTADKTSDFTENIDIEQIMKAIGKLPTVARAVFNMYNIDGFSIEHIANELKMTATAVRSQHLRAKQKLQIMLKSIYDF
ncbi:MAG: sigma-70 family RNA polymerase sigma factor [Prevotellaceae bacterium]|nr:sigma-70 family RNA polymerase sigma factor [Prevotellaceae bacterium]